jgi:hypothetical protein
MVRSRAQSLFNPIARMFRDPMPNRAQMAINAPDSSISLEIDLPKPQVLQRRFAIVP